MRVRYPDTTRFWPFPSAIPLINASLILVLLVIATALAVPGETFNTGLRFKYMAAIANEDTWALFFYAASCLGLWGMVSGRWFVLRLTVAVMATIHFMIALLLIMANPRDISWTYLVFAIQGYYVLARYWYAE